MQVLKQEPTLFKASISTATQEAKANVNKQFNKTDQKYTR